MSGHRRFLNTWARTVGMPIGINDEDKPEFLPITQRDVKNALALRTFWNYSTRLNLLYDHSR